MVQLLMVLLAIFLRSSRPTVASTCTQSTRCDRHYDLEPGFHSDAMFSLLPPLNNIVSVQDIICNVSSRSTVDCGRECMDAEGCVMFTFQSNVMGASGMCRIYEQVQSLASNHENSAGARSFLLDTKAFGRHPNGYFQSSGRCIRVLDEHLSYQMATLTCRQKDGGHVLFLKTSDDLQFGRSIFNAYGFTVIWLGADDLDKEGEFRWTDGSLLPNGSSMWETLQPDNYGGIQNCVCLWKWSDKLDDYNCETDSTLNPQPSTVCQRDV